MLPSIRRAISGVLAVWSVLFSIGAGHGAAHADDPVVHLFTEDFRPYSMTIDGSASAGSADQITGIMKDIVQELFTRADIQHTIELMPWKRAFDSALLNPNTGVFTTILNDEREDLFSWITPLMGSNWVLMTRADADIALNSLDEARQYRIGGYYEDALAVYLENQGFEIDYVSNDSLNMRKLVRGRIDLWPTVEAKGIWMARDANIDFKNVYTIMQSQMGLAMNKATDEAILEKLNMTMQEMYDDGSILRIFRSYLGADYQLIDTQ